EKRALTRPRNKVRKPLKPMVERYADVIRKLGYPIVLRHTLQSRPLPLPESVAPLLSDDQVAMIGVAPFAQHSPKVYPLARMEAVIDYLDKQGHTVLIFGGG